MKLFSESFLLTERTSCTKKKKEKKTSQPFTWKQRLGPKTQQKVQIEMSQREHKLHTYFILLLFHLRRIFFLNRHRFEPGLRAASIDWTRSLVLLSPAFWGSCPALDLLAHFLSLLTHIARHILHALLRVVHWLVHRAPRLSYVPEDCARWGNQESTYLKHLYYIPYWRSETSRLWTTFYSSYILETSIACSSQSVLH